MNDGRSEGTSSVAEKVLGTSARPIANRPQVANLPHVRRGVFRFSDRQQPNTMAEGVHGNEGAGFEVWFSGANGAQHDIAEGGGQNVLRSDLSRSCVKTTQPLAAAKATISESDAMGSPTVDQWIASKPWSLFQRAQRSLRPVRERNETQSGLRFMSIRIFMQPAAALRSLRRATRHMPMPDGCPLPQDTDMRPGSR